MGMWDWLFGKSPEMKAMPTMAPQQEQLFSQLLQALSGPMQMGLGNLSNILSGNTEAYEKPAMRQFTEEILPSISERFSGAGAGAQSSSAFQNALSSAGAGLAERLAMQRSGLQSQALSQLMPFMQMGQQPTFQWANIPGTQGFLSPLISGLGGGLGTELGSLFGKLF